ncbi:MAG: hypothetical protein ACT4PE_11405 [Candidatus Eiseniibacteriota bacterium]
MRRSRWIGLLSLLALLAGPMGLEAVAHDAHHESSASPDDDCPLCVAAKTLAVDVVPQAPALGAELSSHAPPLPDAEHVAHFAPAARRGRSPPLST